MSSHRHALALGSYGQILLCDFGEKNIYENSVDYLFPKQAENHSRKKTFPSPYVRTTVNATQLTLP